MSYEDRISIATPEGLDLALTLAGVGSRFIAGLIDQLIKWAITLGGYLAFVVAGSNPGSSNLSIAFLAVVLFLTQFGYDVLFETLASGRTPGKRWTGLRVVTVEGAPVGFITSAIRNLLRLVDGLPGAYAVAIIAILASPRNQRLGDIAAGTLVVRERRAVSSVPIAAAPPSTWADGSSGWDVAAVTSDELATVRRFLDRRATLTAEARAALATELAVRLRPKVVGPPDGIAPEAFLEGLSAAKAARA